MGLCVVWWEGCQAQVRVNSTAVWQTAGPLLAARQHIAYVAYRGKCELMYITVHSLWGNIPASCFTYRGTDSAIIKKKEKTFFIYFRFFFFT